MVSVDMKEFVKPNKFKVKFTGCMVLFGSYLLGTVLNSLGLLMFSYYGGMNFFLEFIHNLVTDLFSHFILTPLGDCISYGGGGLDPACFFLLYLKLLILQSSVYYLIASTLSKTDLRNALWRGYFFLLIFLHLKNYSSYFLGPNHDQTLHLITCLDVPITSLALLGLFLFAFRKTCFPQIIWKVYFFVYLSWDIAINVVMTGFEIINLSGFLLLLPLYVSFYFYGFRSFRTTQVDSQEDSFLQEI